jgi:purine-binding chemotaxis protein CheW
MRGGTVSETTQYLTFNLEDELFSLEIARVREVLDFTIITKVPRTPDYMQGVINLRGGVVPVVDLRTKFGMPAGDVTVNTCIIIVEAMVDGDMLILGLLADSVQEVLDLEDLEALLGRVEGASPLVEFVEALGQDLGGASPQGSPDLGFACLGERDWQAISSIAQPA